MSYGQRQQWLAKQATKKQSNIEETKQQAKRIVLFDMDGTLTEPRKSFDNSLINPLIMLSNKADIGIVTGSDIDYLREQLDMLLKSVIIRSKLHLLPCNGTKYYPPPSLPSMDFEISSQVNMKDVLGKSIFKQIMISLIEQQASIDLYGIPLTGHFISYRGSMINWCPIGRNATEEDRKKFIDYDLTSSPTYRERVLERLYRKFQSRGVINELTIKLGGSTSFDIYPKGWNKTYCLNHFPNWETWFVGDKCDANGNDKEIYDLLAKETKAFKTESTNNTKLIIENDILPKI